jgi:hypothetical protein
MMEVGPAATELRGRTKQSKAVPSALATAFETTTSHDLRIKHAGWTCLPHSNLCLVMVHRRPARTTMTRPRPSGPTRPV